MTEDQNLLLKRLQKRRDRLEQGGSCYECRERLVASREQIEGFSPRDCEGYVLCARVHEAPCP